MDNKILYQPDSAHENFNVFASKPEPKIKHLYRFINKDGDKVGNYKSILPERTAKKVLKQIFMKTGINNPVYHIYNEDTRTLYKYAGEVSNAPKKKKNIVLEIEKENENGSSEIYKKKINVKYVYVVRQIEYKKII